MWILSPLLLLILTAASLARSAPAVRNYLSTELLATLTLEVCLHFTHWRSADYFVLWVVVQMAVLTAAWGVVSDVVKTNRFSVLMLSSAMAFFFAVSILAQLETAITPGILANDVHSAFQLALGLSLCFAAAFSDEPLVYGTLSAMWMVLALFGFCFLVNSDSPLWEWLNNWLPRAICIVGFSVIGVKWPRGKRPIRARQLRTPPLSTVSR